MGRVLLCRGGVLESGRRWSVRVYDQPANRALLYAGAEYDGRSRARGAVRCLRNARAGADAVLSAGHEAGTEMEHETARVCVLGDQYRHDAGNSFELAADRFAANVSIGGRRLLVGAESRIYANRPDADLALDAFMGRYDLCYRG